MPLDLFKRRTNRSQWEHLAAGYRRSLLGSTLGCYFPRMEVTRKTFRAGLYCPFLVIILNLSQGCASVSSPESALGGVNSSNPATHSNNPLQTLKLVKVEMQPGAMQTCYYETEVDRGIAPAGISISAKRCPNKVKYNFLNNNWVPLTRERHSD
jgi:hypothetical protein